MKKALTVEDKQIATNKVTGKKYFVERIFHGKVYCWGEVTSYRGRNTKHGKDKRFLEGDVEIKVVEKTRSLLEELFEQMIDGLIEDGYQLHRTRAGNVRIIGRRTT